VSPGRRKREEWEEWEEWEEEERRGSDRKWEGGGWGRGGWGGRGPDRETGGKGKEGLLKKFCLKKGVWVGWAMKRQPGELPTARM